MSPTRIGLVLGDPGGVGPELIAKVLVGQAETDACRFVVIGSSATLATGAEIAGISPPPFMARVGMIEIPTGDLGPLRVGEATRAGGEFTLRSLQAAVAAVQAGEIDAIVYAPLNKHALKLAGFRDIDEMHYFAAQFGCKEFFSELNQLDGFWTTRVTSHIPLKDVASLITERRVIEATRLGVETIQRTGVARPRIAVAGLNPHAGDGGTIGREEIEVIAPAVASMRALGYDVQGPVSPDTIFLGVRRGMVDLVVTMYHDQGQIALKSLGFERVVTILGGLPVPAITASSGSAYDIAGRNVANPEALMHACDLALSLVGARTVPATVAPMTAQ